MKLQLISLISIVAFGLLVASNLRADLTLYGGTFLAGGDLLEIDPNTGEGTIIFPPSGQIVGLAFDQNTNVLFASVSNNLVSIDLSTGAETIVGPIGFHPVQALAFDPNTNTLYGSGVEEVGNTQLLTINTSTGAGTPVGPIGTSISGLAFDSYTNTLYGCAGGVTDNRIFEINTSTGVGTSTFDSSPSLHALAFNPITNVLYGATFGGTLVTIDTSTGAWTTVGSTGFPMSGLAFGQPVSAHIVLTINLAEETWELSGCDMGNVEWDENDEFAQVFWTVSGLGTDGGTFTAPQEPALSVAGWTPENNSALSLEFAGDSTFSVFVSADTTTDINGLPITITALGGTNDYSGHSAEFKTAFESLIGSTIPLANGTNFGDILVQGSNIVILGDANGDGVFSNFDIAPFVLALTDPVAYQAMFPDVEPDVVLDMNGDGGFDNLDIADFVAALTGG